MRRTLFLVGLVVGIALTAYLYSDVYYLLTRKTVRFKAVPVECGFFFDVRGLGQLEKISADKKLHEKIKAIGLFQKAQEVKSFFASFDSSATNPFLQDINAEHLIIAANATSA